MTVAIVPVAHLLAANAALEDAGFGPNNFSVAAYAGPGATHAALHAWHDPLFDEAVRALPNVTVGEPEEDEPDDPVSLTEAVITDAGAQWGASAPPLEGQLTSDTLYRYEDDLWWVITGHDRDVFPAHPDTQPALIRRVRDPLVPGEWKQPIDQFDSYRLVNPFTGKPDETLHGGKHWYTTLDYNVFEPGTTGAGWELQP